MYQNSIWWNIRLLHHFDPETFYALNKKAKYFCNDIEVYNHLNGGCHKHVFEKVASEDSQKIIIDKITLIETYIKELNINNRSSKNVMQINIVHIQFVFSFRFFSVFKITV